MPMATVMWWQDTTVEEEIRSKITELLNTETITPMLVYEVLLVGHRMFKQGVGIPVDHVWTSILSAFADGDRHYPTPGQTSVLFGKEMLEPEDLDYLRQ